MKQLTWSVVASVLIFAALSLAASDSVPAGTTLHVRLGTTLTSKTNKPGDLFTGAVAQAVVVNGKEVVPAGSMVEGHVAFVKPSGRIRGKAQMRIVLDSITTADDLTLRVSSTLEDTHGGVCGSTANEEGTIVGCGKSKKDAAKDAALGAVMGAGAGSTVGMGQQINCRYYGNCGGPGMGTDVLYGAAIGAATALIYNLLRHEKHVILLQGTDLVFVVNRTVEAANAAAAGDAANSTPPPQASTPPTNTTEKQ